MEADHYRVLGLPSGEEGAKLTDKEITKAYRLKALELHPDKRPDDSNAHDNFQKLKTSYEILKDEKARKLFDDLLRVKREKVQRQAQLDSKRRKMMSDLEERERSAFAPDPSTRARQEEELIARKLKEEIARIRAMHANKLSTANAPPKRETVSAVKESGDGGGSGLDKEKVLKVSWEKIGEGYTAQKLRELFEKFGGVEDVVIKNSKKKGSALVVMTSKEAVVAALGNVFGDLLNPLLVLPLQPVQPATSQKEVENDYLKLSHLAFEESVLEKMKKGIRVRVSSAFEERSTNQEIDLELSKGKSVEVRQAAGLLLKNNLQRALKTMPAANQQYIKSELFPCMGAAGRHIRSTAGTIKSVLVQIGGIACWPEFLHALVKCLDNNDVKHMEGAKDSLSKICEDVPQVLDSDISGLSERPINVFLLRFLQLFQSPHASLRKLSLGSVN